MLLTVENLPLQEASAHLSYTHRTANLDSKEVTAQITREEADTLTDPDTLVHVIVQERLCFYQVRQVRLSQAQKMRSYVK